MFEGVMIQTQMDSVGPRVIVLHVDTCECCRVREKIEPVNPGEVNIDRETGEIY